MTTREKERFLRMNYTEEEMEIRDRLYKKRNLAVYKIVIYEEKNVDYLDYYCENPSEGSYVDTIYFYKPDQFRDIITLYEGLFYELYLIETNKLISYGMLNPDSPVEEIRETIKECCGVCKFCFWHGMLYDEEKEGSEYKCYFIEHKIYNLLDDYVNEIFLKMQKEFDIESGDISPENAYKLYEKENKLAVLIGKILRIQRGE